MADSRTDIPPAAQPLEPAFGFWTPRPFKSMKTPETVLAATRFHEDYLSIMSLDEGVRAIRVPRAGAVEAPLEHQPDFEVTNVDGSSYLVHLVTTDVDEAAKAALFDVVTAAGNRGISYRVVDEAWVGGEPRLRNARLVFGCRRTKVSPGDRVRILHFLNEQGASPLIEVAGAVASSPDAVECVLALVAEGNVMVDLNVTMGPEMPVWRLRAEWDASS